MGEIFTTIGMVTVCILALIGLITVGTCCYLVVKKCLDKDERE